MKILFALTITGLLLIGCSSGPASDASPARLVPTRAQAATASAAFEQDPAPSPTNLQLPLNPNIGSNEDCKPPYAVLPVEDGNDISENEIVYELVRIWLRRYAQPSMPPFCRIAEYTVDNIYDDPGIYSKVLEPRGDFMRVVVFSVKLVQVPSDWMSFTGELDQDNWLHVSHIVAITKTSAGYKLEFAYP
jgi:hypothetical protein